MWGDENIAELFDRQAERYPGKVATVDGHVRWTYAELHDKALQLAGLLLDLGVKPGDPVLTQLPGCALQPLVHLACVRVGALYVPLPSGWRRREVAGLLERLDAGVLIAVESDKDFDLRALHAELMDELPGSSTRCTPVPANRTRSRIRSTATPRLPLIVLLHCAWIPTRPRT